MDCIKVKASYELYLIRIVMPHDLYELYAPVKQGTDGIGVFTVSITNATSDEVSVVAGVHVDYPPEPFKPEDLSAVDDELIPPGKTVTVLLMKPLMKKVSSVAEILSSYRDIAARPKLDATSELVVYIEMGPRLTLRHKVQRKVFPVKYVEGTLFVDVPPEVSFVIE